MARASLDGICLATPSLAAGQCPIYLLQWGALGNGPSQFNFPVGVASDHAGAIYVVDSNNNRVQKFSESEALLLAWGSGGSGEGQFNAPYGVAVDASGNVYVADGNNNRIQKFTATGTFVLQW